MQELDRLRTEPVSERELTRAKNQFTRDYVLGRETVQQKASVLAHASVLHKGDVASADAEFDLFQGVTRGRHPAGGADVLRARTPAW